MGVHDVQTLAAAASGGRSDGAGRGRRRAALRAPGGNSYSSTSRPGEAPQRGDLVADEASRARGGAASGSMFETTSARTIRRP